MKENKSSIFKIESNEVGPTIAIFCGIHGDEIAGIKAVKDIANKIQIKKGTLYCVIANEQAIEMSKREDKYNMNRMFGLISDDIEVSNSYEYKRVKELEEILNKSDALLDLHSSGTPESVPFLIFEKPAEDLAKKIAFPIRTSGWNKIHKGSTDEYMFNKNKIAICAECGFHNDPNGYQYATNAIDSFLKYFDMTIDGGQNQNKEDGKENDTNIFQENLHVNYSYITEENFLMTKKFSDFEEITEGQKVGTDGGNDVLTNSSGKILFVRNRNKSKEEAFIILSKEN